MPVALDHQLGAARMLSRSEKRWIQLAAHVIWVLIVRVDGSGIGLSRGYW